MVESIFVRIWCLHLVFPCVRPNVSVLAWPCLFILGLLVRTGLQTSCLCNELLKVVLFNVKGDWYIKWKCFLGRNFKSDMRLEFIDPFKRKIYSDWFLLANDLCNFRFYKYEPFDFAKMESILGWIIIPCRPVTSAMRSLSGLGKSS
jgi:hypothetical protein